MWLLMLFCRGSDWLALLNPIRFIVMWGFFFNIILELLINLSLLCETSFTRMLICKCMFNFLCSSTYFTTRVALFFTSLFFVCLNFQNSRLKYWNYLFLLPKWPSTFSFQSVNHSKNDPLISSCNNKLLFCHSTLHHFWIL